MSQMLSLIPVLLAALAAGILLPVLLRKKLKKPVAVLIGVGAFLLVTAGGMLVYLNIHYSAEPAAVQAFAESDGVTVTETADSYFFDGSGQDSALIFYGGAKVDCEAYAPLMHTLAQNGVDCFLLKLPFRMALMDSNAAQKVMDSHAYPRWYLGGHSMGGVAASVFTTAHPAEVKGLVLLAAYPTAKIDDPVALLTVYGTEDKVLNREQYEKARQYFPADTREVVIDGGNHAGFGNYGKQDGDGEATVSPEEQQRRTAQEILALCR